VIPYTHHYTAIYRAVSIPSKFERVSTSAIPFSIPVRVKKGQALFLTIDCFISHHLTILYQIGAIAMVCGVMSTEARYINCFKNDDNEIEIFVQADDYIFSNPNFLKDNLSRPRNGTLIRKEQWREEYIDEKDWAYICDKYSLTRNDDTRGLADSPIRRA
jgi:hypothetical protein